MGVSKRSKIEKLKEVPIKGTTFGDVLGAVLKVKPPTKKVAKEKVKPKK